MEYMCIGANIYEPHMINKKFWRHLENVMTITTMNKVLGKNTINMFLLCTKTIIERRKVANDIFLV